MNRLIHVLVTALLLTLSVAAQAIMVNPLDERLVSVETTTSGSSRAEAEAEARRQAVLATAGRVLLEGHLIRADQLLDRYLRNYADNFVTGVEVLSDRFTAGQTSIRARVFVDYARLVADMREKRFLYEPAYRPQFTVFIEERLDGQEIAQVPGRQILTAQLTARGLKSYAGAIDDPPIGVDLRMDSDLLKSARIAAERRNIEIIFTGKSHVRLREQRNLYYDQFYFYDCEMELSMIRVDTGETLASTRANGNASERDRGLAVSEAIDRASQRAVADMMAEYRKFWPEVIQSDAQFEVLLTGANDELIKIVSQHIERMSPSTRVSLRKKFDASAVLAVSSDATRERLLEILSSCPYPTLTVVREAGKKRFEVQVSG